MESKGCCGGEDGGGGSWRPAIEACAIIAAGAAFGLLVSVLFRIF